MYCNESNNALQVFCWVIELSGRAGVALWWCVEFAVLLDVVAYVPSSSGENFSLAEGVFPLELSWVLTPFPSNSFG